MAETLFLAPQTGAFDVTEIARFVSGLGYAVEDSSKRNRFAVFADQDESTRFVAKRVADPKITLPYVCVIEIAPDCVTVSQLCEAAELAFAKQFVAWLLSRYRCTVSDDEGDDLTEAAARSVDEIY